MHCREFKDKHVAFVDDTLAGVESAEMQAHTIDCSQCARHDALIRRSLMLVRNLPTIQPSAGFSARLEARIAESLVTPIGRGAIRKRVTAGATLAAAAMIGYIAFTLYRVETPRDLPMAPVIASIPESEMAPLSPAPAALIASAPAGLAIWPAALFAEQAPARFAHSRFTDASLRR
jgi:hypothetical protein